VQGANKLCRRCVNKRNQPQGQLPVHSFDCLSRQKSAKRMIAETIWQFVIFFVHSFTKTSFLRPALTVCFLACIACAFPRDHPCFIVDWSNDVTLPLLRVTRAFRWPSWTFVGLIQFRYLFRTCDYIGKMKIRSSLYIVELASTQTINRGRNREL
jgi:hypothetical protein